VAERNWHRIDKAPRGLGPMLLRITSCLYAGAFVGYQCPDSGRWFDMSEPRKEVHPTYYCMIPLFDADDPAIVPAFAQASA
jgi:hypothetical protein